MSKVGKRLIQSANEAVTMAKLMGENERLRAELNAAEARWHRLRAENERLTAWSLEENERLTAWALEERDKVHKFATEVERLRAALKDRQ